MNQAIATSTQQQCQSRVQTLCKQDACFGLFMFILECVTDSLTVGDKLMVDMSQATGPKRLSMCHNYTNKSSASCWMTLEVCCHLEATGGTGSRLGPVGTGQPTWPEM